MKNEKDTVIFEIDKLQIDDYFLQFSNNDFKMSVSC